MVCANRHKSWERVSCCHIGTLLHGYSDRPRSLPLIVIAGTLRVSLGTLGVSQARGPSHSQKERRVGVIARNGYRDRPRSLPSHRASASCAGFTHSDDRFKLTASAAVWFQDSYGKSCMPPTPACIIIAHQDVFCTFTYLHVHVYAYRMLHARPGQECG